MAEEGKRQLLISPRLPRLATRLNLQPEVLPQGLFESVFTDTILKDGTAAFQDLNDFVD
jgi:hypothetical protein